METSSIEMADPATEADILLRAFAPPVPLTPEAAEALLALRFPDEDITRLRELHARNSAGEATAADLRELEAYSRVGNMLNMIHSCVRTALHRE